jgi:hypothetical protein
MSVYLSDYKQVYWYHCDEIDDRGWGCGWRVMQTVSSLLFDKHVTFADINEKLESLGYDTKNKDGRLAFADAGWICEYFRNFYPSEMKMFAPIDFVSLDLALEEISQFADPKVIVLVTGGMIVCMDALVDKIGHFIDPHLYEELDDPRFLPPLVQLGKGGIGQYSIPQLFENILDTFCVNIDDPILISEIKSS